MDLGRRVIDEPRVEQIQDGLPLAETQRAGGAPVAAA